MTSHIKNAAMTTGIVLLTLYVLNQFSGTRTIVQKAITGA